MKNFFKTIFKKKNIRQESLDWWDSLSHSEQITLEKDYFDSNEVGETTEIDIEAMYKIHGKK